MYDLKYCFVNVLTGEGVISLIYKGMTVGSFSSTGGTKINLSNDYRDSTLYISKTGFIEAEIITRSLNGNMG